MKIKVISSILLALLMSATWQAQAYTEAEQECYGKVQGRVAWNQNGDTGWSEGNVRDLCKDVLRPEERIGCFTKGINAHGSWNVAIKDCANTGGAVDTAKVPGKQCIYNKGGYILTVDWYDPGKVVFDGGRFDDYTSYTTKGKPHKSENISLGYSSCTDVANRSAVVRMVGHDIANAVISIGTGVVVGAAVGAGGAFACVASAGAACPAAFAVTGVAATGAVSAVGAALPKVDEISYIGVPGTKNFLDFYGTVWKVGMSSDVALTETRKPIVEAVEVVSNEIKDFVTDGKPGPKSITFNNQAGYVAEMVVLYHTMQDVGGNMIPMPVTKSSGNLSLGFSKHIDIPGNLAALPISVFIKGVGTIKGDVFSTTVPYDFEGNQCYKSWGTIFDAKGGVCKTKQ